MDDPFYTIQRDPSGRWSLLRIPLGNLVIPFENDRICTIWWWHNCRITHRGPAGSLSQKIKRLRHENGRFLKNLFNNLNYLDFEMNILRSIKRVLLILSFHFYLSKAIKGTQLTAHPDSLHFAERRETVSAKDNPMTSWYREKKRRERERKRKKVERELRKLPPLISPCIWSWVPPLHPD